MRTNCKGCTERKPGCHDHCETYKKYKEQNEEIRERRRSTNMIRAMIIENVIKLKKRSK